MSSYEPHLVPELDDWTMPAFVPEKSADEVAAQNGRRDVPPGEHLFTVAGFLGVPETKSIDVYVDGKQTSYLGWTVGIRLALANDPGASIVDFFTMPPSQPSEHRAYFHGGKNADTKNPGFHANKFMQFLRAIGYDWPAGTPFPEDARKIKNWLGRKVIATVEEGNARPKENLETGVMEEVVRREIKLFSYAPESAGLSGKATPSSPRKGASPVAGPVASKVNVNVF